MALAAPRALLVIASLALLSAPVPAIAASSTEVLGVSPGKPMKISECPKVNGIYQDFWLKQRCWTPDWDDKKLLHVHLTGDDQDAFSFINGPSFGVFIQDGTVASIVIATKGVDVQDAAFAALTKKFGKPNDKAVLTKQNRMGATFKIIEASWARRDAEIHFWGAKANPDVGGIYIVTPAVARQIEHSDESKPTL